MFTVTGQTGNNPDVIITYTMFRIPKIMKNPIRTTLELLRAKDSYNRISLKLNWAHDKTIKFDRLKMDYGDSRMDVNNEKRKYLSEGLKICK